MNEEKTLETFMATLLAAGFDPHYVLECGYKAAHGIVPMEVATLSEMHAAADLVLEAAKKLEIDAESQRKEEEASSKR